MFILKNNVLKTQRTFTSGEAAFNALIIDMGGKNWHPRAKERFMRQLKEQGSQKVGIGKISYEIVNTQFKKPVSKGNNNDHLGALGLKAYPSAPKGAKKGASPKRGKARK